MNFDRPNRGVIQESTYQEGDIRMIARLLGTVIACRGDFRARKKRLLSGLAKIVGADAWAWTFHSQDPGRPPVLLDFMAAGIPARRLTVYQELAASQDPACTDEAAEWLPGRGIGFGPALFAGMATAGQGGSLVGMLRKSGACPFSERETALYHLVVGEIPWLHHPRWMMEPAAPAQVPARRLATVLDLLLRGFSRKQIADDLGIRLNTVHGYVRTLYARFQVNSHPALLQACLHGDPSTQTHERARRIVG